MALTAVLIALVAWGLLSAGYAITRGAVALRRRMRLRTPVLAASRPGGATQGPQTFYDQDAA
jgi:hypothetical protein